MLNFFKTNLGPTVLHQQRRTEAGYRTGGRESVVMNANTISPDLVANTVTYLSNLQNSDGEFFRDRVQGPLTAETLTSYYNPQKHVFSVPTNNYNETAFNTAKLSREIKDDSQKYPGRKRITFRMMDPTVEGGINTFFFDDLSPQTVDVLPSLWAMLPKLVKSDVYKKYLGGNTEGIDPKALPFLLAAKELKIPHGISPGQLPSIVPIHYGTKYVEFPINPETQVHPTQRTQRNLHNMQTEISGASPETEQQQFQRANENAPHLRRQERKKGGLLLRNWILFKKGGRL